MLFITSGNKKVLFVTESHLYIQITYHEYVQWYYWKAILEAIKSYLSELPMRWNDIIETINW